ncbi:Zinc metalloproteinase nas-5 [Colletotrichum graminicola]|nr:Zinc metalloproteinase nas-5 [Colletotrichum graminicola]
MPSITLKAAAAMAVALSQPVVAAVFPTNIFNRSEIEAIPLEKRGSMDAVILWDKGEIPYILEGLPHDLSNSIRDSMRVWEQRTCIRFVPKQNQLAWVYFNRHDDGCYSNNLGSPGLGEVIVNLDYPNLGETIQSFGTNKGCMEDGVPTHELGHVIGLIHEQQRPDRDQFIHVFPDAIMDGWQDQYTIHASADTSVPFDYNSIMLYRMRANTKRGYAYAMVTITDKEIDPWDSPTDNDFLAVNNAYGCEEYYTRSVPECRPVSISADENKSSYTFMLDKYTERYMRDNGYTHVAAHQNCRSNTNNQDTDNWGFTPLNGWGPMAPYQITVDRCKKRFDRHASRYEVALCKGDDEGSCDIKCGLRRICPFDANGKQVDSKAVNVVDDALWVCHPH